MKIKKLIEYLEEFNPEADITLTTSEDIYLSYIEDDECDYDEGKKTTKQVFIEPTDSCPECVHEYMSEEYDVRWCSFYDKPCKNVVECYQFEEFVE